MWREARILYEWDDDWAKVVDEGVKEGMVRCVVIVRALYRIF